MNATKYRQRLQEIQVEIMQGLLKQGASSYDEYKKQVGIHSGLQLAIDEIKDFANEDE